MDIPRICLCLTEKTLEEDLKVLEKYRKYADLVELRVDHLDPDETLYIRKFPSLANMPCILTIRREIDGGKFIDGESARTILFARALSFADEDRRKNFEYVDFEDDYHIPSLEDATMAFGTKIIRSFHDMENPVDDIISKLKSMNKSGLEIPKIAFTPHSLDDVTNLYREAAKLPDSNHILLAMGHMGLSTRILGSRLKNYLTYTSAPESTRMLEFLAHVDVEELNVVYHMKEINERTKIYGITGWPLKGTSSPAIHNKGYKIHGMNSVYIPFGSPSLDQTFELAETLGLSGFSVTVPYKEDVLRKVDFVDEQALDIGSSNTVVRKDGKWLAYNTDADGFSRSLLEFMGIQSLRHKKVAIIGAGGAAKAVAYAVHKLNGKACIFNRTLKKAQELADLYGFDFAPLAPESSSKLRKYSEVIIQTTSKGMHSEEESNPENDPIFFYDFTGKETLFDIVYMPEETPVMKRAKEAGCMACNGFFMLRYQAYKQFELFTGEQF